MMGQQRQLQTAALRRIVFVGAVAALVALMIAVTSAPALAGDGGAFSEAGKKAAKKKSDVKARGPHADGKKGFKAAKKILQGAKQKKARSADKERQSSSFSVSAQEELTGGCELKENTPLGTCALEGGEFLRCNFPRVEGAETLEGTCRSASLPGQEPLRGQPTVYQCELSLTDGAGGPPPDSNPNIDFGDVRCAT